MTDVPSVNFDRAAGFYDATRRVDDAELTQTLELLSRTLGLHDSTLEIGVGTGALALPLAGQGWSLTGVDIAAAMLSRLIEKADGRPPLALVRSDATALPFADGSFAGAYVRHVFHLIPRWRAAVAELCRVTRGNVAVCLGASPGPWHDLWYEMRTVMGSEADHVGLSFAHGGAEQSETPSPVWARCWSARTRSSSRRMRRWLSSSTQSGLAPRHGPGAFLSSNLTKRSMSADDGASSASVPWTSVPRNRRGRDGGPSTSIRSDRTTGSCDPGSSSSMPSGRPRFPPARARRSGPKPVRMTSEL